MRLRGVNSVLLMAGFFLLIAHVYPPEVEGARCLTCRFNRPSSTRNLGAQPGAASQSSFRFGNIFNSDFIRSLTEVQGASRLLSDGRNLFERALIRVGGRLRLVVRQLGVDGVGRLVNLIDPRTVTEVKDVFLKNFDNFKGKAARTVARFLNRAGVLKQLLGGTRVGVRGGVVPPQVVPSDPKYRGYRPDKIMAAALSYMINTVIALRSRGVIPIKAIRADGTVSLPSLRGLVDGAGFARLISDNPYDCSRTGVVRADWLVTKLMDPNIYYQVAGLEKNQKDFTRQIGWIDDKFAARGNKILVAGTREKPESVPARNTQRVLEFRERLNARGRFCFRSYDFTQNPTPGVEERSRDVRQVGIFFTNDAGEWLCQGGNYFMFAYLTQENNGNRLNFATSDAVTRRIGSPGDCIGCHTQFWGGGVQNMGRDKNPKPYTDHYSEIPFGREFFTRNSRYRAAARIATANMWKAQKRAGAWLNNPERPGTPLPVAADVAEEFRKSLTIPKAAQELNVNPVALKQYLKGASFIPRAALEGRCGNTSCFCSIKKKLGGARFYKNAFQVPDPADLKAGAEQRALASGVQGPSGFTHAQ